MKLSDYITRLLPRAVIGLISERPPLSSRVVLCVVLMILLTGCVGFLPAGEPRPTVDDVPQDVPEVHPDAPLNTSEVRELEITVLQLVNYERGRRGIGDIRWSPELARVNDYHAWHMWDRDYFYHVEPDGDDHDDRIEQFGYRCPEPSSEVQQSSVVLKKDTKQSLARDLVDGWMNSPAHRSALLNTGYDVAGVGIYIDQTDTVYAVMVLCQEVNKRPANVRGTNETVPQPPNETTTAEFLWTPEPD